MASHPHASAISFAVISADRCPLYAVGDRFILHGTALTVPPAKQTCLILADDIFHHSVAGPQRGAADDPKRIFDCKGCTGRIRLSSSSDTDAGAADPEKLRRLEMLVQTLGRFSLFTTLEENELRNILPDLKVLHVRPGAVIIRQGQEGSHLHIILEGSVEVLATETHIRLAILGPGEVFGEMSLLSGNVCTASIRACEACRILTLDGKLFREMVQRYPSMQRYIFQLLAHRLRTTNLLKESQLAQGVHGNLSDLSLPEFLQALNISKKSGAITLTFARGAGAIAVKDGQIVDAAYLGGKGKAAFFEMLTEANGTFTYLPALSPEQENLLPLGEFMNLLMEGFVRIDESRRMLSGE